MNADKKYKKVLYIDLSELEYEFKNHEDLHKYMGGIGVGSRLYHDYFEKDPVILSAGPLCGYFPYVSKSVLVYENEGKLIERVGGGNIGPRMNFLGIDAILLTGKPVGRVSINVFEDEVGFDIDQKTKEYNSVDDFNINEYGAYSLEYFSFGETTGIHNKLSYEILLNIEGSKSVDFEDFYGYERLYNNILADYKKLTVEPRNNPSCLGCPIGCDKSHLGEDDVNIAVLPRCLVACGYAEEIYNEIPLVFSCLSSLGFDYKHEDLEILPQLVGETKKSINDLLDSQLETE